MQASKLCLPVDPHWESEEQYVDSLLKLVTTSDLLRNLCGGVHILDFLTRKPDLYSWVLPEVWRQWFDTITVDDLLDLLLREDLDRFHYDVPGNSSDEDTKSWREFEQPPKSLILYIRTIRLHSLIRSFQPVADDIKPLPRMVAVGMKPKKSHEVANFAAYVDQLSTRVSDHTGEALTVIDFGSGQNYLGRTLALPPYNRHVVAIEKKHNNVAGAKDMDVLARLTKKEKVMRNKKEYKRQLALTNGVPTPPPEKTDEETPSQDSSAVPDVVIATHDDEDILDASKGSMTYIEHELVDGHLEEILYPEPTTAPSMLSRPKSVAVSIHSCGNLTHHGLRSLILNRSVSAVAMIGCCYNLLTERLGPPTYKHPQLRSNHPRLEATSNSFDPSGFPMSTRLENYTYEIPSRTESTKFVPEKGVRLNITARMMAVQAPYNWGPEDSRAFFKRHFYRALLQRIFLDRGVVKQPDPSSAAAEQVEAVGGSLSGKDEQGSPLIIGSLRKAAFLSFQNYVAAALEKLYRDPVDGTTIKTKTADLLADPSIVEGYERRFAYAEKNLAVIWSLMAFSAGVVESTIVIDRWLWLREQQEVEQCWVQTVFDYAESPRNLCVVGVKKPEEQPS